MPRRRETPHESDQKIKSKGGTAHQANARAEKTPTPQQNVNAGRGKRPPVKESRPLSPAAAASVAPSRQLTVAVVGAGRLGSALALALGGNGYRVSALVTRRAARARLAARALSPRPLLLDASQLDLLPDTDLLLITTPDDQIAEVAARLAGVAAARRASHARRRPRIALHASGALTSDALAPLGQQNFSLGSLHPLVSISDPRAGAQSLAGAFYCLEGEAHALAAARKIVRALGGRSFSVAARDKSLYHAAAVIASGHAVALFSLAADLLSTCGLGDARARRVLLPLLASTLDNLKSHAPDAALTGTFARADLRTVRRHLAALRETAKTDALAIYALLGARSLRLAARRRKFDSSVAEEINALLRSVLDEV